MLPPLAEKKKNLSLTAVPRKAGRRLPGWKKATEAKVDLPEPT